MNAMRRYKRPPATQLRANVGMLSAIFAVGMFYAIDWLDIFSIDPVHIKMIALAGGVLAAFVAAALGGEG